MSIAKKAIKRQVNAKRTAFSDLQIGDAFSFTPDKPRYVLRAKDEKTKTIMYQQIVEHQRRILDDEELVYTFQI